MAVLDSSIQKQIDRLTDQAYEQIKVGNPEAGFKLYERAWELYPDPKNNWNEAYNVARYAADDCFALADFENAKKWINRMIEVNNNLHQSDEELCFYIGKYKFEMQEYEAAWNEFRYAVRMAGMRYFEDEDPKYRVFYNHPERYKE